MSSISTKFQKDLTLDQLRKCPDLSLIEAGDIRAAADFSGDGLSSRAERILSSAESQEDLLLAVSDLVRRRLLNSLPIILKSKRDYKLNLKALNLQGIDDKVTGIDGKEYKVPEWEAVRSRIGGKLLQIVDELEHAILLLDPTSMSLEERLNFLAVSEGENYNPKKHLKSYISWARRKVRSNLLYEFTPYTEVQRGRTKAQILSSSGFNFEGFSVSFVDGCKEGPERTRDGSIDYLTSCSQQSDLDLMFPDEYLTMQLLGKLQGVQFDELVENYLKGYQHDNQSIPVGYFGKDYQRLQFCCVNLYSRVSHRGCRRAARL